MAPLFRYGLAALMVLTPALLAATTEPRALPVINNFASSRGATGVGVWATDFLQFSVSGATSVTIDQGIGTVTGMTSVPISPTVLTTYTLTATNASGSVTATFTEGRIELVQISASLYKTEHAVYYIPDPAQVQFPNYSIVMSLANINNVYLPQLQSVVAGDYMMVVIAANHLAPNSVPNVITQRHLADGIGDSTITGTGIPNLCRYNIGGGNVTAGSLSVLDHEIGHNWSARSGAEVSAGHWYKQGTVHGQMADNYFNDDFTEARQINGNPVDGFTWTSVNNILRNQTETFSDQDLYLMGLHPVFPDTHVLTDPVLNPDHSVSYSAVNTYGHAWMLGKNGARTPSYRTSDKQFRIGFIFVAQNLQEIQEAFFPFEQSITQFENAEAINTSKFSGQVPFLVATKFRASINARLADLDGNTTPTLALGSPSYLVSSDGTAAVSYSAGDADGEAPTVSLVPASPNATFRNGTLVLQGLPVGTSFFTLKAEDQFGKKAFQHFVVDVTGSTPVITWPAPAATSYGTPLSATQLNATASVPGTFAYSPAAGTVLLAGTAQTLMGTFTPTDTSAFSTAAKTRTIDVTKATPLITWVNPGPIQAGRPLSAVQLNAIANVPGVLTYAPPAGTVLGVGAQQTLSATFVPTDSDNYTGASKSVTIDVVTTPVFTDDPLVAGITPIKAVHLTELREDVDILRQRFGLGNFSWVESPIAAGAVSIKVSHIVELRTALGAVFSAAGISPPAYTTIATGSPVAIVYFNEIRAAIVTLW
jgi:hypothetical protein